MAFLERTLSSAVFFFLHISLSSFFGVLFPFFLGRKVVLFRMSFFTTLMFLQNDISDLLDLTFSIDADEEKLILYERTQVPVFSYCHV